MKKYLITGLLIFLPLFFTLLIILFLVDLFTNPIMPIVESLIGWIESHNGFTIPNHFYLTLSRIFSLILLGLFILLLGTFARIFFFREVIAIGQHLFEKIPFLKTIYRVSRDLIGALLVEKGKAFQRPVLIPFPDLPSLSVGFISGEVPQECVEKVGKPLLPVFAPTVPHPISGFFLLVPEEEVRDLPMTNEETIKFLVSCGLIVPHHHPKP